MCRHQFHDISMHNVSDIDEICFFDNGGSHFAYTYMHIHKTTFVDHEIIFVDTIFEMM